MYDASAPPFVAQLRTEIAGRAIWISECADPGNEILHIHYPRVNISGVQGTRDPLPAILITQKRFPRFTPAEGAGSVVGQVELEVDIYLPATVNGGTARTAGYLETFADTLMSQLFAIQPRIIPYREQEFGEASDPTPGEWAADKPGQPTAYHHIRGRIMCGYSS